MMIELEEGMWVNPDNIESVWEEIVDAAGEIVQVHVKMVSGDEHRLFNNQTLADIVDKIRMAQSPADARPAHTPYTRYDGAAKQPFPRGSYAAYLMGDHLR